MSERYKVSNYYSSGSDSIDDINKSADEEMDKRTKKNLAALEDIFSQSGSKEESFFDNDYLNAAPKEEKKEDIKKVDAASMEQTGEINKVQLDELRDLVAKLKEMNGEEPVQENGQSQEKGKTLSKSLPGIKPSGDVDQILTSFIACVQLAGITALFGFGWLMYLINHI